MHRVICTLVFAAGSTVSWFGTVVLLGAVGLLLTTLDGANAQASRSDTLRVLTYNLHGLLTDEPKPNWDSVRIAWLAEVIETLDPDVVGFQEVLQHAGSDGSDNQIRTLADTLSRRTGRSWEVRSAVAHPSWERFDEGVAILTRHPIVRTDEYMLKPRDVFQRNLLAVRIRTSLGDIDVFTTHLAHRPEAESTRTAQVSEIKQHVGFRGRESIPAIIVGDFNATPDTPSIRETAMADSTGHWIDAFATVNPDVDEYSYPAEDPNKRIDYVFLADPGRLMPASARVVLDETRGGKMLSDHLGVVVDFVKR